MARDIELKKWNDEMKQKLALARGESIYEGEDIEGLMSSGSSGAIWKRYREQEKARSEKKAEIARVSKNMNTADRVKVFKTLAERYSSSLLPRVGLLEAQKVGAEMFARYCQEAGIKEIAVPGYRRYEKTRTREQFLEEKESKKKEKKGVYFEESQKEIMESFVGDLQKVLQKRVKKGEISQEEADKQVTKALKGLEKDFGIANKGLGISGKGLKIPKKFLENKHNDPDILAQYYFEHIDEATDEDSSMIKDWYESDKRRAEMDKDYKEMSGDEFLEKYSE